MRTRSSNVAVVFAASLACSLVGVQTRAGANPSSCKADSDCQHGFSCQVTSEGACPPTPKCPPGENCPSAPECVPTETKACVPGSCKVATDCASDMVCLTSTSTTCSGSAEACSPGSTCPPPPAPVCTTTSTGFCAPRYLAPCHASADCGSGFSCVPEEACACSGSSGGGSSSSGGAVANMAGSGPSLASDAGVIQPDPIVVEASVEPFIDGGCSCSPTGQSMCQPNQIACSGVADCPSGWSCAPQGVATVCNEPASFDGAVFPCPGEIDAGSACEPPYWDTQLANGSSPAEASATSSSGSARDANDVDAAAEGTVGAGATPTAAKDGSADASGGCAMGGAPASSGAGAALLAIVASFVAAVRRRRTQRLST